MGERTDSDILSKKPISVVLGERTFAIIPQAIRKSREFKNLVEEQSGSDPSEQLDLVYQYSPELAEAREYIETQGTESQLVEAFTQIMGLAYGPFAKELPEKLSNLFGGAVRAEIDRIMETGQVPTKPE